MTDATSPPDGQLCNVCQQRAATFRGRTHVAVAPQHTPPGKITGTIEMWLCDQCAGGDGLAPAGRP